jgi:hypothetical protein
MERTHVAIQELVDRIDREELKLPEIQRGYIWKPAQVASLIDSLYHRYPSGAMLIWRPSEEVMERPKSIVASGVGPMAPPQYLLDGQQRLTSLHRVMKRHPQANIVLNVEEQRFQVQSAATAKDPRWVLVADVLQANKLSSLRRDICEAVPALDEDEVDERLGQLKGILRYEYYLEILTDLSYREVADIFVRVNSKGRALNTVDLTLAVLSAEWPGVVAKIDEEEDRWRKAGWPKIDAGFLVRALAATATDATALGRLPATSPDDLEAGWQRVKHGTEFLLRLLRENLGLRTSNLIPSMNALVPLVVLLGRFGSDAEFTEADAVIYWLLSVFLTGRYSSAADTKIAQDALAARSDDPIRNLYGTAGLSGAPFSVSAQQLIGKGAGSPFFLLSYLVAKNRKAKDWWHDVEINESSEGGGFGIEYHHVHPQATLKQDYAKGEINDLANLAFISSTANKKISDRSPADYFGELLDGRDELTPHLVPLEEDLRISASYHQFLARRRQLLANAMTELLDSYRPAWVTAEGEGSPDEESRAVTLTLVGDLDPELGFRATLGDDQWLERVALSDLERFISDVEDGLASSIQVGGDVAAAQPGAEEISVPVGPYELVGSADEWRTVIEREKDDRVDAHPAANGAGPFTGERAPVRVVDTD